MFCTVLYDKNLDMLLSDYYSTNLLSTNMPWFNCLGILWSNISSCASVTPNLPEQTAHSSQPLHISILQHYQAFGFMSVSLWLFYKT